MTKPECVIFDCDGVLIDSEILTCRAWHETLAELGINMTLKEVMNKIIGRSEASNQADIEMAYQVAIPQEYIVKKRLLSNKYFENDLKAIPGIVDFIDAVPMKKCVASGSSPEHLRRALDMVGLSARFAPHIFSAAQVKNGKPAPDLFLFAAEQMGVAPSACFVIEDSIVGVRAAKAAAMKVYGFTGGGHCDDEQGDRLLREGADAVFDNMKRMTEAFRDL